MFQRMSKFPKAQLLPFLSSPRAGRSPRSFTKPKATTLISWPRFCRFVFCVCVCVLRVLFLLLTHTARKVAIHSSWLWPYQTESVTLTSRGGNELDLDTNAMDIWALLRTPTCGAHTNTHTLTSVSACIVNATSYACNRSPANFTEQWSQIIRQYWIAWPFCCGPLDLH